MTDINDLFLVPGRMDNKFLNYIMSVLSEIRTQVNDYGVRLMSMDLGTCQGIRDNISVFTAQLADVYGDIVTEHEMMKYEYNARLKERKKELWSMYMSDNLEINPEGKVSSTQAQDKARYQAEIDLYNLAKKIARLKGLEEQANALWRYTIPKLQDSIASRISLTKEYPNGLPTTTMPMSQRHKSDFGVLFGDLDEQVNKAQGNITEMDTYQEGEIPEDSSFNNPDL